MTNQNKLTLREWRGLKLMSRRELSEITGISERMIQNYEMDINTLRSASYVNVEAIAKALGIAIDDIFLGDNSQNTK